MLNVFQAFAVESNANKAHVAHHNTSERAYVVPTMKAGATSWMEEMQDTAEVDLLRYELEHGGRFSSAEDLDSRS